MFGEENEISLLCLFFTVSVCDVVDTVMTYGLLMMTA